MHLQDLTRQLSGIYAFFLASVSIEDNLRWCSVQPGVALMKAFWMDGLRYSFSSI